jgi:hypothetical protein
MKTYLYDYYYDGGRWSLEITAHNKDDADEILKKLPMANCAGELKIKVPAITSNWLANLIIKWKNFMGSN